MTGRGSSTAIVLAAGALFFVGSAAATTRPHVAVETTGAAAVGLEERLGATAPDLDRGVLHLALQARDHAVERGLADDSGILSVIDFSVHSSLPRLWVFDTDAETLLYRELVSHGIGSGDGSGGSVSFSNTVGSRQSSLGLFRMGETYYGRNGYSLRMHGLEPGYNDLVFERAVVFHGADYVSDAFVESYGRIGRSWGCPAVRREISREVIDTIKDGSLMFAYYPDASWLDGSALLDD